MECIDVFLMILTVTGNYLLYTINWSLF